MSGAPCVLELRANEYVQPEDRPHVPRTPAELVADATAARAAGASVYHWHARDARTGRPTNDPAVFSAAARGVREASGILLHPTLGHGISQDPEARTAHIAALAADPATAPDLVPIDFGSINVDRWDVAGGRFATGDAVYLNPRWELARLLEIFRELEVGVIAVCWNVGHVRTALRFRELGLLRPAVWQLVFTGETLPDGMAPTRAGFAAMLEYVPDGEPWSVLVAGADPLAVAGWAIERGGHVATGLGDWAFPQWGSPTNAEVMARVAQLAVDAGRPVATPEEARGAFGLRVSAPGV